MSRETLHGQMERLATAIATEAMAAELPEKVAALKSLLGYQALINKLDPPDIEEKGFGTYRSTIESASAGGARDRRGNVHRLTKEGRSAADESDA